MKKKKSFTLTAVFVALVVVLNNLLNFMLVQPGLNLKQRIRTVWC